MSKHDVETAWARWRTSSYSGGNGGACVEVADMSGGLRAVRDSKDPAGPVLTVPPGEWAAFIVSVRGDDFG